MVHLSIYLSYLSIYLSIYRSSYRFIVLSSSIYRSIYHSIYHSIYRAFVFILSFCLSTHLSIYLRWSVLSHAQLYLLCWFPVQRWPSPLLQPDSRRSLHGLSPAGFMSPIIKIGVNTWESASMLNNSSMTRCCTIEAWRQQLLFSALTSWSF